METKNGIAAVQARNPQEWRQWLSEHSAQEKSVWLIIQHKKSQVQGIKIDEAMTQALCFGWIDSKAIKRDSGSFYLCFTPRNPKSNWSTINRERAAQMIREGQMTAAGQAMISLAQKTGTWEKLSDAQSYVVPDDLQSLLDKNKKARTHFEAFAPSSRRMILEWIANAKRPETRERRIQQTVALAADNIKANHPKV